MPAQIIFIVGPTGVGKSALGMTLARKLGAEIVSCDAMQVYHEVNIACDKPVRAMQAEIPHHMINVATVTQEYDVAQYAKAANAAITHILSQGKIPIVVGGSGMYVTVLLDGIFESPHRDESFRTQLFQQDPSALHATLSVQDPQAAAKIHPNDAKRLVRALEVLHVSGQPISTLQKDRTGLWGKYDIKILGLYRERTVLYRLAEERIDRMFAEGLVEEVQHLSTLSLSRTAAAAIGIPEVQGFLRGEYDLDRAKYLMKRNTRHYIKRQLTWFRRDKRVEWIEGGQMDDVVRKMRKL